MIKTPYDNISLSSISEDTIFQRIKQRMKMFSSKAVDNPCICIQSCPFSFDISTAKSSTPFMTKCLSLPSSFLQTGRRLSRSNQPKNGEVHRNKCNFLFMKYRKPQAWRRWGRGWGGCVTMSLSYYVTCTSAITKFNYHYMPDQSLDKSWMTKLTNSSAV